MEKIIQMHDFLTQIDFKIRCDLIDEKTKIAIEEEVTVVREKFNELFEMIKKELFI